MVSSFAIQRNNPNAQARARGLVPTRDPNTGITYFLDPNTGETKGYNDPSQTDTLGPIIKALAIGGVGAGFGAGALDLLGYGALLPGATVGGTEGSSALAGGTGAADVLGADAIPAAIDITPQIVGSGALSPGLSAADLAAAAAAPYAADAIPAAVDITPQIFGSGALSQGVPADVLANAAQGALAAAPQTIPAAIDITPSQLIGFGGLESPGISASTLANAAQAATPATQSSWLSSLFGGGNAVDPLASIPLANSSAAAASGLFGVPGLSYGSLGLGALSLLSGLASKNSKPNYSNMPGPGDVSQGPLFNQPLGAAGSYLNRSRTDTSPDYYHYGEYGGHLPTGDFFTGNQLSFPNWATTSMARGGALARHAASGGGNAEFDTRRGDREVRGQGGGQDDNVSARLSPGEWVADANFVSAIGDGNTAEGSRRLYAMRRAVMREKGMKKTVPPKLKKSPQQYLKKASRR